MNIKRVLAFLALFSLFTTSAEAGLIYGTIKIGNDPLSNHDLEIVSGDRKWFAQTNERGSYSIKPDIDGPCKMTLFFENQTLEHIVYSQDQPVRYDLVVVKEDNVWVLKRR